MDDKNKQCRFACDILYQFASNKEKRLKYGAEQRLKIKKALEKGRPIHNYRTEWSSDTSDKVIEVLIESSEKFNNTFFQDKISVDDLKDILESTIKKLTKKTSQY